MAQNFGTGDAGANGDATVIDGNGPYCAIGSLLHAKCTACHRTGAQAPSLEFEAAKSVLLGDSPTRPGVKLVVPGAPDESFLYRKISGALVFGEGTQMPPLVPLAAEEIAAIRTWIEDGASLECSPGDGGQPDLGVARFHPDGFALPENHGPELKFAALPCRDCHGQDLSGGAGPSCDSCHTAGWRTNCTFCHGGTNDSTGAPPRDLDGQTLRESLVFRAHSEHAAERNHAPFDCLQCHQKPADVLTVGHIFDDTPGHAEVFFGNGLSANGLYEGSGRCSNLYCHGNGRATGAYDHTRPRPDCNTCHAGPSSGEAGARLLSGRHRKHVEEGIACRECHAATVDAAGAIIDPAYHVNGTKDVVFGASGMTRATTCTGTCHGEGHSAERW